MASIIVEWSLDGIRIASVERSGRLLETACWSTFEHHDDARQPDELAEEFRAWLTTQNVPIGEAILVLPREALMVRQLQLPEAPDEEIPDLVRFQSAAKSSLPIDELVIDYLLIESSGTGRSVLTASIDRRRLQRMTEVLSSVGFEVISATMTPLTVGQFAEHFGDCRLGQEQPELVLFQRDSLVEMSIFDRGSLVFSHSVVLADTSPVKPVESSLARSIVALRRTHPNVNLEQCYLVGTTESNSELQKWLQQRFHGNVQRVKLPDSHILGKASTGFESLVGAAVPLPDAALKLDLLHPRQRVETPDRRRLYWLGGAVAAAVLLTLVYGMFLSQKNSLQTSIASLNTSITEIEKKLDEGEPDRAAFNQIQNWSAGQTNPVAVWNQIQRYLPGTDELYLTELRLQAVGRTDIYAKFSGVGFARQRNDVEEFYQKLAENGFRVRPQPTSNTRRDPDYPVRFELDVDLLRNTAQETSDQEKTTASVSRKLPRLSSSTNVILSVVMCDFN